MHPKLYDRKFALAFAGNVLFVLANVLLLVHFGRWVHFLDGNELDLGWILGVGAIPAVLLRPWIGRWIDRLGPRLTWAAGYGLFIMTALTYLLLDRIGPAIYILRAIAMVAPAIVFTSSLAYIAHMTPPARLAEAIGTLGAAGLIGIGTGPLLGDLYLGQADQRGYGDFVLLFGTAAVVAFAAALTLPFLKPTPPHPEGRRTAFLAALHTYWPGWSLLICFAFGICMAVQFGFLAKFADAANIGSLGLYFVIYAIWAVMLRIQFRTLPQRIGRRRLLVIGMSFWALGLVTFAFVDRPLMLILPAILCGTGHAFSFPPMTALVMQSFPTALRGTGSAVALMALDTGTLGSSPVIGWIAFHHGYPTMFLTAAAFVAASIVVFWFMAVRQSITPAPDDVSETQAAPGSPAPCLEPAQE